MSNKSEEIKGKLVDYQVVDSINNANTENSGQINVVVTDDDNNSLYIGNTHIASGYGLKTLETKHAVEKLLKNDNIKKLLEGNLIVNPEQQETPTEEISELQDSSIYFHNDKIMINNGVLLGEHWIDISDISIRIEKDLNGIITNETIKSNDIFETSMLSKITIKYIIIEYSALFSAVSPYYKIFFDDSVDFNMSQLEPFEMVCDGKKHSINIPVNIEVIKDLNYPTYKVPVKIFLCDRDKTYITNLKICDIKFKYPIFSDYGELFDINNYTFDFNTDILYDENGTEITTGETNNIRKHYFIVPYVLEDPKFILKSSDIRCNFNNILSSYNLYEKEVEYNGILYKVYESPKYYTSNLTWIIK